MWRKIINNNIKKQQKRLKIVNNNINTTIKKLKIINGSWRKIGSERPFLFTHGRTHGALRFWNGERKSVESRGRKPLAHAHTRARCRHDCKAHTHERNLLETAVVETRMLKKFPATPGSIRERVKSAAVAGVFFNFFQQIGTEERTQLRNHHVDVRCASAGS